MQKQLKVLTVDDSEDDALLLAREFRKHGFDAAFTRVDTQETLLSALGERNWDIALCDYSMPHFDGIAALQTIRETTPDLPVIIVSGTIGEDLAVEAMRAGANDYLMKDNLKRLMPAVERELRDTVVRMARKRAEQEKLELERRLLHSQKLESLGVLAGGIAHDFNNILAGIMGYADLALTRLPTAQPARADIEVIKKAVQRAAGLTRQMLAYSGKGKFVVEPVSLSRIVKDMRDMLEISISKKAVLKCSLAPDLPTTQADASQIHQVILNLVINASEALGEESGVIAISTDTIQCNATDWAAIGGGNDLREGLYVRLEVADTGCGMDEQTLEKIFDPFFTTKFTGRGLGLAAVHGIVRGHKGGLRILSAPGKGTTFQVLFPACDSPIPALKGESVAAKPRQGRGAVLVVDDEEMNRESALAIFEQAGFSTLTAKDGEEAIRVYQEHQDQIVCVFLDLTLPKMDGEKTFRAIRQRNPEVRVIVTSGFSGEILAKRFAGLDVFGFVCKPEPLDDAIAKLRGHWSRTVTRDLGKTNFS